jgi:hypothetical protein
MFEKENLEPAEELGEDEEFTFSDDDFDALVESRLKEQNTSYVAPAQSLGKYTDEKDIEDKVSRKVKEILEERDKVSPSEATLSKIARIISDMPENESVTRE